MSMLWAEKEFESYSQAMNNMFIIRAEHMLESNTIEYVAYSPLFDIVVPGAETPEYICEVLMILNENSGEKEYEFTWHRQPH